MRFRWNSRPPRKAPGDPSSVPVTPARSRGRWGTSPRCCRRAVGASSSAPSPSAGGSRRPVGGIEGIEGPTTVSSAKIPGNIPRRRAEVSDSCRWGRKSGWGPSPRCSRRTLSDPHFRRSWRFRGESTKLRIMTTAGSPSPPEHEKSLSRSRGRRNTPPP